MKIKQHKIPSKRTFCRFLCLLFLIFIYSCKSGIKESEQQSESRTPVTVTNITIGSLDDIIDLNATSSFLVKTYVKANSNGYLLEVNAQLGERVSKGQKLFVIRSKEAENLGNTINTLDSTFRFNGQISIKSPGDGYITQLSYRAGDYVQDGETIAAISDISSLVFLLQLPYELKPFLSFNKTIDLTLPDGQKLTGNIASSQPIVDMASQTQNFVVKISSATPIPENLIANARFVKKTKPKAASLPKEAILTNEVQSEFWVMKMIDSITAIKVPIVKGIETTSRVEILSPAFNLSDKILLTGNYGLPDTAKVTIENRQ